MQENPLLSNQELPAFADIKPEHVETAVSKRLAELSSELLKIENNVVPTWEGLLEPLCQIEEKLHRTWAPVDHLNSVANSSELRVAYEKAQQPIIDFHLRFMQSQVIYDALLSMKNGPQWDLLDEAQHRSIKMRIRSANLAGLGLSGAEREEFNALNKELSQLETEFSNRLLDSTKEFALILSDKDEVDGLPESLLALSSQMYKQKFPNEKKSEPSLGPWVITLDAPVFVPFLENAKNRELRKKVYLAYIARALHSTWIKHISELLL